MQRHLQKGMSYIGFLLLACLVSVGIKVIATVGPDYYDNYSIGKMVNGLLDEGRTGSVEEFKRALYDRFQINGIRDRTPDDFEYQVDHHSFVVIIDYEVRKPFMGNLDVVMHFNKTYSSEPTTE